MEKITKKHFIELLQGSNKIQFLGSSWRMQNLDGMDSRLDDWDGAFINYRSIHKISSNRIEFVYMDHESDDTKKSSYLYFGSGDMYYKHHDFIVIQSKYADATIIYKLIY